MSDRSRYAILLDGGFVIKKLQQQLKRFPNADDVEQLCSGIMGHPHLANKELLRCYFYHAPPAEGDLINPLDKSKLQLGNSPVFRNHTSLMGKLELKPNFALRLGETVVHEWRLGTAAMRALMGSSRAEKASGSTWKRSATAYGAT